MDGVKEARSANALPKLREVFSNHVVRSDFTNPIASHSKSPYSTETTKRLEDRIVRALQLFELASPHLDRASGI